MAAMTGVEPATADMVRRPTAHEGTRAAREADRRGRLVAGFRLGESDAELAVALGIRRESVQTWRLRLGLVRAGTKPLGPALWRRAIKPGGERPQRCCGCGAGAGWACVAGPVCDTCLKWVLASQRAVWAVLPDRRAADRETAEQQERIK